MRYLGGARVNENSLENCGVSIESTWWITTASARKLVCAEGMCVCVCVCVLVVVVVVVVVVGGGGALEVVRCDACNIKIEV